MKSVNKQYNKVLYVPTLVNVKVLLKKSGHSETYINDHLDKYHYVLHKIIEGRIFNYDKDAEYTNLSSKLLEKVLGKDYYKQILVDLVEWGIINCDNYYRTSAKFPKKPKSKGYKITDEYKSTSYGMFIEKPSFEAKLNRLEATEVKESTKPANYIYQHLKSITIDDVAAKAFIANMFDNSKGILKDIVFNSSFNTLNEIIKEYNKYTSVYSLMFPDLEEEKVKNLESDKRELFFYLLKKLLLMYDSAFVSIDKIKRKDYFLSQPNLNSRVFTNITGLSRHLRQFLKFKKSGTLVNIDIRNSQPFLFNIILNEYFKNKEVPKDVRLYYELTKTGKLYEYIMNIMGIPEEERDCFKITFFAKIFYCCITTTRTSEEGKVFKSLFPNVAKVIAEGKKGDYSKLANIMQEKEADIILNKIVKELSKEKVFVSTIHDSFVVKEEDSEKVMNIVLNMFDLHLNLEPSIKVEILKQNLVII